MQFDVRHQLRELRRELKHLREEQVPQATAWTINDIAKYAAPAVQTEMRFAFDRPTPWTLNSYRVLQWAKKRELTVIVGFKDTGSMTSRGDRSDPGVYLQPQMEGTSRPAKGLEYWLRANGMLGSNEFLVPSEFQRLDAYGNVSRGVLQKILANLRAYHDSKNHTPSRGARGGRKKADYFFTRRGVRGARLTAIWQNFGAEGKQHAVPAFIVVASAPRYKKRFDHVAVVDRQLNMRFGAVFEAMYLKALATAR